MATSWTTQRYSGEQQNGHRDFIPSESLKSSAAFLPMKTVLQAKVVNPQTGEVLPLGQMGEIMTRGHCVMLGYWGDPAKTKECMTTNGWYKTG